MTAFTALLARDLRLAVREGGALGTALGFYLVVVAMLPLSLGPDLNLLSRIGAGILWLALLLAALLYAPGTVLYAAARREQGLSLFGARERALFVLLCLAALAGLAALATGALTI